jgi:hypothetical protein
MRIPGEMDLTYRDLVEMFLPVHTGDGELEGRLADFLGISPTGRIMANMRWLGLFSDEPVPRHVRTATEALCHLLERKLRLEDDQRDLVVIMHDVEAHYPSEGQKRERIVTTMVQYGEPGGLTAMARTVGMPAAVAAKLILTGELTITGCHIATHPMVFAKVLPELERGGIRFSQRTEHIS